MCYWCGHGPPLRPYYLSVWTSQNCIGLLSCRYNTWHDYFIEFLYPTIAPQNSSFPSFPRRKSGVLTLDGWSHTLLCFFHVRTSLRMSCNYSWCFDVGTPLRMSCNYSWCFEVCNASLNAPHDTLSPMSYGEMKIIRLIFFPEIWSGVTSAQLCLLYKVSKGFISPTFQIFELSGLPKSSKFQDFANLQTFKML